jgi:hypothetical protein
MRSWVQRAPASGQTQPCSLYRPEQRGSVLITTPRPRKFPPLHAPRASLHLALTAPFVPWWEKSVPWWEKFSKWTYPQLRAAEAMRGPGSKMAAPLCTWLRHAGQAGRVHVTRLARVKETPRFGIDQHEFAASIRVAAAQARWFSGAAVGDRADRDPVEEINDEVRF